MVENGAVERFGSCGQSKGEAAIGLAGISITARVIMRQHDAGAVMAKRIGQDRLHREASTRLVTLVTCEVQATRVAIDMRHPQILDARVGVGNAAFEEAAGRLDAI